MLTLKNLGTLLHTPQKIVLTTHHKPDGDALGSTLALSLVLQSMGHQTTFISPTDYPAYFSWMPGIEEVMLFSDQPARSIEAVGAATLIFALDFNHLGRIYDLGEWVGKATCPKIMIDHHLDPEGFADLSYWDVEASSTCQLVYRLLTDLDLLDYLAPPVATCLYTGIMTDSGSFRFPRTTAELHRITAALIDRGADNVAISERVHDHQTLNRLKFLGLCLFEKLVVLKEYNTAYFLISRQDMSDYQIETGDTEGIVNYALSIASVQLAVLMVERGDKVKLSFRSKGIFPANQLAATHFSGGGHLNAAGGQSEVGLEETLKKFLDVLPDFRQLLVT